MQALVSIITPTYNSEKYITDTINSVLQQTYSNWELIIVDDGSTDETVAIVSKIAKTNPKIKVFQLQHNSGPGFARNFGTQQAQGKYLAFLDADDLWKPEKLTKQVAFMQNNNLPFTFSFYEIITENGTLLNETITTPKIITYKNLFYCNWIGNLTGIYSAGFFGKLPISHFKKRQDWLLWLDIVKKINTATPVPESLAYYRKRNQSVSSSKFKLLKHNFKVYHLYHKQNYLLASFNLFVFLVVQLFIKPKYKIKTVK